MDVKLREWLDLQYSPSKWSKRMPADDVIAYHIKVCHDYSESTRLNLKGELNVSYGANKAKMDIFYPEITDQEKSPVIMFVHGGAWQSGSKDMYDFVSNSWIMAGCIAAIVGYNLAPEARMDDIITEIQAAVEFVTKRFPESKLFLCGHSAGAHLCAMMSVVDNWNDTSLVPQAIRGMCLISGLFDLVPVVNTYANDALNLDESSAARHSPLLILKQSPPTVHCPTLVVIEEHATEEFRRQSKEFAEILKSRDVQCSLLELPGVDHFNVIENMVSPEYCLCKEILKLVHGKS